MRVRVAAGAATGSTSRDTRSVAKARFASARSAYSAARPAAATASEARTVGSARRAIVPIPWRDGRGGRAPGAGSGRDAGTGNMGVVLGRDIAGLLAGLMRVRVTRDVGRGP